MQLAGVIHLDDQHIALEPGADVDHEPVMFGTHAVLDGILRQPLQRHVRYVDFQRGRVDLALALQLPLEAQGLYAYISLRGLDVLLQPAQPAPAPVQRIAQIIGQAARHLFRDGGTIGDLGHDGVERIEEKVRLYLQLQMFQLQPQGAGLGLHLGHAVGTRGKFGRHAEVDQRPDGEYPHVVDEAQPVLVSRYRPDHVRQQQMIDGVGDRGQQRRGRQAQQHRAGKHQNGCIGLGRPASMQHGGRAGQDERQRLQRQRQPESRDGVAEHGQPDEVADDRKE
ncbi:hypothetical protein D3C71_1271300 [compost metagenome]